MPAAFTPRHLNSPMASTLSLYFSQYIMRSIIHKVPISLMVLIVVIPAQSMHSMRQRIPDFPLISPALYIEVYF